MHLNDLLNPKTGPENLRGLALYPLFILVIGSLAMTILSRLTPAGLLVTMLFFMLVSPVAYLIRGHRLRPRQRQRPRRGAERTPVLPSDEEEE